MRGRRSCIESAEYIGLPKTTKGGDGRLIGLRLKGRT